MRGYGSQLCQFLGLHVYSVNIPAKRPRSCYSVRVVQSGAVSLFSRRQQKQIVLHNEKQTDRIERVPIVPNYFYIYRVAQKSKPPPIFQKIALKIANEIRFLRKVKV